MACLTDSIPWRGDFEQKLVYAPEKRPGFVAWVTAFPYGDGSIGICLLYTSPSPRDRQKSRMPSSA